MKRDVLKMKKFKKCLSLLCVILLFSLCLRGIKNTYAYSQVDLADYYENSDTIYDMSDLSNITPLLKDDNT